MVFAVKLPRKALRSALFYGTRSVSVKRQRANLSIPSYNEWIGRNWNLLGIFCVSDTIKRQQKEKNVQGERIKIGNRAESRQKDVTLNPNNYNP